MLFHLCFKWRTCLCRLILVVEVHFQALYLCLILSWDCLCKKLIMCIYLINYFSKNQLFSIHHSYLCSFDFLNFAKFKNFQNQLIFRLLSFNLRLLYQEFLFMNFKNCAFIASYNYYNKI